MKVDNSFCMFLISHLADSRSTKVTVKRAPTTVMLDRARHRLSTVLTGLISHDRRLTQRIVELARDPLSYFGNLVRKVKVENTSFVVDFFFFPPSTGHLTPIHVILHLGKRTSCFHLRDHVEPFIIY